MKFEIAFERTYPHPVEKVWHSLTDRSALALWLMETDFVPEQGHAFEMWCEDGNGSTDRYLCRVLALDPPHHMAWSWVLDGRQGEGATRVDFVLRSVSGGTHLVIRHSGDRDRDAVERFKAGWPHKLDRLEQILRETATAGA